MMESPPRIVRRVYPRKLTVHAVCVHIAISLLITGFFTIRHQLVVRGEASWNPVEPSLAEGIIAASGADLSTEKMIKQKQIIFRLMYSVQTCVVNKSTILYIL